ncbi:uncharacterized protein LOC113848504 [Abrus precatorius]|uniref:DNA-directed RNA polymerase n=1 Tax=Abrus precatorius TaxID=3816 RepID=A0A8B8JQW2_ABRPR|nr:uncharacterized protein LOC113848504 [Abrus precatorius]
MEMLTKTEMPSAKEYLRGKYLTDKTGRMTIYAKSGCGHEKFAPELSSADVKNLRFVLSDSDQSLLKEFGEHTLECLLVHTLGQLFNLDNSVSLAGLVERIESNVRVYASFLRDNSMVNKPKDAAEEAVDDTKAKTKAYPFGTALVEFLVTRDPLRLKTYNEDELNVLDGGIPKVKRVVKKGKGYYRNSFVYAECLFNTALLPIKLSLPMVFPPKDWEPRLPEHDRMWLYISDIYGGYLSNPTGQIYSTQRCMSTPHAKNFFIYFGQNKDSKSHEKLKRLCTSISSLQRQAFKINSPLLNCIINHRALFEDYGFLMPEFLSKAILPRATGILRRHFNKNRDIESIYTFNDVCSLLMRNMQQARYECTILDLAKAYNGYSFYFPAFLDFRGRIYRSGIFHFHERDLARSLLLFDCKKGSQLTSNNDKELFQIYVTATRFHYQSYNNEFEALSDANDSIGYLRVPSEWDSEVDYIKALLSDSQKAKHPFQYFSNMHLFLMRHDKKRCQSLFLPDLYQTVPVTQDASASAYQLMAYFLLDESYALLTNLINGGEIFDIYSNIRLELIEFLKVALRDVNPELCAILDRVITRSIVKQIYMPIIYGKTVNSTTEDLKESLFQDVLPKECPKLAALCFQFWKTRYSYMNSFIGLIGLVGRACSSLERPVLYDAVYFSTSQDYKIMEKHTVRVFNSKLRKPHKVTLSYPSNVRDKRKSRTSTFVNFIHQKDAQIAMSMAFLAGEYDLPLYTVHDNFITNTYCCEYMPSLYLYVIKNMGPPLKIINRFIYRNLIEPAIENGYYQNDRGFHLEYFDDKIIPDPILDKFLKIGGTPPSEVRNVAGWKKITEQLKQSYQLYCKAVCGPNKTFAEHLDKWNRFSSALKGPYCIHH